MTQIIKKLLKYLPTLPGIYKMKDQDDQVIYVGKAKNLKNRVSSYFSKSKEHSKKTEKMVEKIASFEFTLCSNELEAIMLETNLIKELKPKYNILMKDDKNFSYIKITVNEDYPRILVVRKVLNDKAKYFGPKSSTGKIYDTLNLLRKIFPFRTCNLSIEDLGESQDLFDRKRKVKITHAGIKYPCLDLHIKRCLAPCIGKPDLAEYRLIIDQIISFLDGKYEQIVDSLKAQMNKAAEMKQFEKAAKTRDKIVAISDLFEKQLITSPDHKNSDIINYYIFGERAFFSILQFREGKMIDQQNVIFNISENEEHQEILLAFLSQYYLNLNYIPEEIFIPEEILDLPLIEEWLKSIASHKVRIIHPKRGDKDKLIDMALENAKSYSRQIRAKWEGTNLPDSEEALEQLARYIGLEKLPRRIECYDISHLSGTNTVASMVVFENGHPKNEHYRHFKISLNTPGKPDDFASMQEVIFRRLKYLNQEKNTDKIKLIFKNDILKVTLKAKTKIEIIEIKVISTNKLKTFIDSFKCSEKNLEIIIKKITQKFNSKRIYFIIDNKNCIKYEKLGFNTVRKLNENLNLKKNQTVMVFDKSTQKEDQSFKKIPDLIVIDGGKGQLSSAIKAFSNYKLEIPIISIAKKEEEFFTPNREMSIKLPENDLARLLIQQIRDEAHRFAIEYQRKLRKNDFQSSSLEEIEGIGKNTSIKLIKHFGSVENIKKASEDEIADIIGTKMAIKIKSSFI